MADTYMSLADLQVAQKKADDIASAKAQEQAKADATKDSNKQYAQQTARDAEKNYYRTNGVTEEERADVHSGWYTDPDTGKTEYGFIPYAGLSIVEADDPPKNKSGGGGGGIGSSQITTVPVTNPDGTPVADPKDFVAQNHVQTNDALNNSVNAALEAAKPLDNVDIDPYNQMLKEWLSGAIAQNQLQVDYATQKGVNELQRAEEDAQPQFQAQRNQIDIDEQKALANQALYAESRGDRGGIGQAQYGAIQNTAAVNRLSVQQAQTKLSTDTARQIADLRAQGEFEKADAVLELTQKYLTQMMSMYQWGVELNLSIDQFNKGLDQYLANFKLDLAKYVGSMEEEDIGKLASTGSALLAAGIMPSDSQLAAMGFTPAEAQAYLTATTKRSGGGGGNKTPVETLPFDPSLVPTFEAIQNGQYNQSGKAGTISADVVNQYYAWNKYNGTDPTIKTNDAYVHTQDFIDAVNKQYAGVQSNPDIQATMNDINKRGGYNGF